MSQEDVENDIETEQVRCSREKVLEREKICEQQADKERNRDDHSQSVLYNLINK